jgi:hypothetical protein
MISFHTSYEKSWQIIKTCQDLTDHGFRNSGSAYILSRID